MAKNHKLVGMLHVGVSCGLLWSTVPTFLWCTFPTFLWRHWEQNF